MPHTKQQLQQLLASVGIAPRRRWGQNFLIDLNLMRLLVAAAQIKDDAVVLEVGCGTGSLTDLLAERAAAVVAVEIDSHLATVAAQELSRHRNVTLICDDILESKNTINPAVLEALKKAQNPPSNTLHLVANLPYQVAAPVMMNLLLLRDLLVETMAVTVQAEVAQRMLAPPASKIYGSLSILLQATGAVKRLRTIGPQAFWPEPKVNSAMVTWQRDNHKCRQIRDIGALKQVIDLLLRHRRKKIKSSLAQCFGHNTTLPADLEIDLEARAETLSVEKYVRLANLLDPNSTNADGETL